jgi:tRNA U38,U39,U40 pseudouridine synthase TruA/ribosomal protein S20
VQQAQAAETASGEVDDATAAAATLLASVNAAPIEVVHMTQGWAHDPAKYTYMAAVAWKHRRSHRASPLDLTPNAPRPGTAAYHNSHQAVTTGVTAVSAYRGGQVNTDGACPAAADDVFVNGSGAAKAAAEAAAGRAALEASQRQYKGAAAQSAASGTPWRLDPPTLARLRLAAEHMVGCNSFHNFTPKMGPGDAACKRTVRVVDVSDPFLVDGTEYVRITLRGQSFILNQIRHIVACMADFARGALATLHLRIIFSRNTKLIVPLAPATGLFLHNPEFDNYNRSQGTEHGPIEITEQEPVCSRVQEFKVSHIYPHMHKQIVQEKPFEEFSVESEGPRYYRHVYIDTNPESTHASKTAMKDYTKRFFGRIAKEMGHGKATATVTAMKRADKGAAKHLFSEAQKAAKKGRYSGKRKRW